MANDLLTVSLKGGSLDGQIHKAPRPPGALRVDVRAGEDEWSEMYLYDGKTVDHPQHGTLPVMVYWEATDVSEGTEIEES